MTGQNKSPTANLKTNITTTGVVQQQDNKDASGNNGVVDATDHQPPRATADTADDVERLDAKYAEFKGDPEKMQQLDEFVSGLLASAEKEADIRREAKRLEAKKGREGRSSIFTGIRRGRMLTRARTVVVRWFEAICNCTTGTATPLGRNGQARPMLQKAHTVSN